MQILGVFVLFACLVAAALAQNNCPNSCSNHGVCNQQSRVCSCNPGWFGSDCSIAIQDIAANQPFNGNVALRGWNYFRFSGNGNEFRIKMNHSSFEDADIYVRKNQIPDISHYDFIDVGSTDFTTLTIPATPGVSTVYYIGVHGFTATRYILVVESQTTNCPNDCSRHGRCSTGNVCTCDANWGGKDCSIAVQEATLGTWSSTLSLGQDAWLFYHVRVTSAMNFLKVEANMTAGDVDIFVKRGRTPSLEDWDYVAAGTELYEPLTITTPPADDYYIGFYGFLANNPFRFRILAGNQQCPNRCSGHGTCNGIQCSCYQGYTGAICDTYNRDLTQDTLYTGHVDSNEWNYYQYVANSGNSFVITVMHDANGDADCDLFVNSGSVPTRFRFQYRDIASDAVSSLRVDNPGSQRWYIGVYGFSTCTYNMTISADAACPGGCGNNGRCVNGQCICSAGWAGEKCDVRANQLTKAQSVHGTITTNRWIYYTITTDASSVHVILQEAQQTAQGALWLFVRVGGFPTLDSYDYHDTSLNNKQHQVNIHTTNEHQAVTYYIGVYGSPYLLNNVQSQFDLVAWYPPF